MPIATESPRRSYKDFDISFTKHPTTNDIMEITGFEVVKRSIKNIILTNFFEKPMKSEFGGNITAKLFDNFTPMLKFSLEENIKHAITKHEPRAVIEEIKISDDIENHQLNVSITFSIINSEESVTINTFLYLAR